MGNRCTRWSQCCFLDPKVLLDKDSTQALFLFLSSAEGESLVAKNASKLTAKALLTSVEYHNALQTSDLLPVEVVHCIIGIRVVGLGEQMWSRSLRYIQVTAAFGLPRSSRRSPRRSSASAEGSETREVTYYIYREAPPDIIHYKSSSTGFSAVKALDIPEYM